MIFCPNVLRPRDDYVQGRLINLLCNGFAAAAAAASPAASTSTESERGLCSKFCGLSTARRVAREA